MKLTKRHRIGVIGGTGKTGAQFARLFRRYGYAVRVTDAATRGKNASVIDTSDVILFALPLSGAADLMKRMLLSARRKDQLILDVSSLKAREVKAMLFGAGEVIGMHPLFGPSTDPEGERIVLCPARAAPETVRSLRALLQSMGLKTSIMTPSEHDTLMTTVQVIPHLKSLLMADVLRSNRTNLGKMLKLCTPTYEMEFNVIARFLDDHPDLYMPIIFRNPNTLHILRRMQSLIGDYIRIAADKDLVSAENRYRSCKTFFKSHLKRARSHSEACIQTLLTLKR